MAIIMEEKKSEGTCKRCGNCCLITWIRLDPLMTNAEAEFAMRRVGASRVERMDNGQLILFMGPCPYLSKDRSRCLIYEKRPAICKAYPPSTADIVAGCYYFDNTEKEITD